MGALCPVQISKDSNDSLKRNPRNHLSLVIHDIYDIEMMHDILVSPGSANKRSEETLQSRKSDYLTLLDEVEHSE